MAINKISLLLLGVLAYMNPAVEPAADTVQSDTYGIPHDKLLLELCRQSALRSIPGRIDTFQIHNTAEGLHYRFEIEAPDRTIWEVVCNISTQKIIRTQRID